MANEIDCVSVMVEHTQDVKFVKWHPVIPEYLFSCSYDDTIIVWGRSNQDAKSRYTESAFALKDADKRRNTSASSSSCSRA